MCLSSQPCTLEPSHLTASLTRPSFNAPSVLKPIMSQNYLLDPLKILLGKTYRCSWCRAVFTIHAEYRSHLDSTFPVDMDDHHECLPRMSALEDLGAHPSRQPATIRTVDQTHFTGLERHDSIGSMRTYATARPSLSFASYRTARSFSHRPARRHLPIHDTMLTLSRIEESIQVKVPISPLIGEPSWTNLRPRIFSKGSTRWQVAYYSNLRERMCCHMTIEIRYSAPWNLFFETPVVHYMRLRLHRLYGSQQSLRTQC